MLHEKGWKYNYKAIIQQLEGKESDWQSTDSLLRDAISRVSIAGHGINPMLDEQLKQIQKLSNERNDSNLGAALDELSRIVESLQSTPPKAISSTPERAVTEASTLLSSLLDDIQFREEQHDELTSICDNLLYSLAGGKNNTDIKPQIHKLASLINRNFSNAGTVGQTSLTEE